MINFSKEELFLYFNNGNQFPPDKLLKDNMGLNFRLKKSHAVKGSLSLLNGKANFVYITYKNKL